MNSKLNDFLEVLQFLKRNSFNIIDYPRDLFFQNFKAEFEDRYYGQKLEEFGKEEFRFMVLDYLGMTTRYSQLNTSNNINICNEVWTYPPYLEDFVDDPPFVFIIDRINKMITNDLPITKLRFYQKRKKYFIEFLYRDKKNEISDHTLLNLGIEFIIMITRLVRNDKNLDNLYLISSDPGILIACKKNNLSQIENFFELKYLR